MTTRRAVYGDTQQEALRNAQQVQLAQKIVGKIISISPRRDASGGYYWEVVWS